MSIAKRIGKRLKRARIAALLVASKRHRDELRDEALAAPGLRCALEAERSNVKAADAVLDAYLLGDRQLRGAIEEIAIPALRRCGEHGCASAGAAQLRLEEALPAHIDEARIRETSWSRDGWE